MIGFVKKFCKVKFLKLHITNYPLLIAHYLSKYSRSKKAKSLLAPMETASFCDEERKAKDIVDSGFPAPENIGNKQWVMSNVKQAVNMYKKNLNDDRVIILKSFITFILSEIRALFLCFGF